MEEPELPIQQNQGLRRQEEKSSIGSLEMMMKWLILLPLLDLHYSILAFGYMAMVQCTYCTPNGTMPQTQNFKTELAIE